MANYKISDPLAVEVIKGRKATRGISKRQLLVIAHVHVDNHALDKLRISRLGGMVVEKVRSIENPLSLSYLVPD